MGYKRWIRYEVSGQTREAGPYDMEEIYSQQRDIKSYEGIENVRILDDVERTPMESFLVREGH